MEGLNIHRVGTRFWVSYLASIAHGSYVWELRWLFHWGELLREWEGCLTCNVSPFSGRSFDFSLALWLRLFCLLVFLFSSWPWRIRSTVVSFALLTTKVPALTDNAWSLVRLELKKNICWALRFPLPSPSATSDRRFSSTPAYRHGPRSGEALDGAIRVAAHLNYSNILPSWVSLSSAPGLRYKVWEPTGPPSTPTRSSGLSMAQKWSPTSDKSGYSKPCPHSSENKPTIEKMSKHFCGHSGVNTLPRLTHPKQMVWEQAAMASGSVAPSDRPPPVIANLRLRHLTSISP